MIRSIRLSCKTPLQASGTHPSSPEYLVRGPFPFYPFFSSLALFSSSLSLPPLSFRALPLPPLKSARGFGGVLAAKWFLLRYGLKRKQFVYLIYLM